MIKGLALIGFGLAFVGLILFAAFHTPEPYKESTSYKVTYTRNGIPQGSSVKSGEQLNREMEDSHKKDSWLGWIVVPVFGLIGLSMVAAGISEIKNG